MEGKLEPAGFFFLQTSPSVITKPQNICYLSYMSLVLVNLGTHSVHMHNLCLLSKNEPAGKFPLQGYAGIYIMQKTMVRGGGNGTAGETK